MPTPYHVGAFWGVIDLCVIFCGLVLQFVAVSRIIFALSHIIFVILQLLSLQDVT